MTFEPDDHEAAWAQAEKVVEAMEKGDPIPEPEPETDETEAEPEQDSEPDEKAAAKKKDEEDDKNEGKVTPAERAGFRAEKRKWKARQAEERQAIQTEREKLEQEFADWREAKRLRDAGDTEAALEKWGGAEAAKIIQEVMMKAKGRDPRVERELAEAKRFREEQEQKAKEAELQQAKAQRQRQQAAWAQANIVDPLKASEETASIAEEPFLVNTVFAVMSEAYDPDTDSTIELEEALELAKERLAPDLKRAAALYQSLYGDQAPASPETGSTVASRPGRVAAKKGSRARTVPTSRATSASAKDNPPDPVKEPERWMQWAEKKMRANTLEDTGT
jgi:hypothetical protein